MTLLIPPGYAHAVVQFRQAGDPEPQVCTFGVGPLTNPSNGVAIANNIFGIWKANILVSQTNNITLEQVTVYVGQEDASRIPYDSTGVPANGSGTQDALPSNCAMLVRKRTGVNGRRGRGRFYVPGVAEGTVDANGIVATATQEAWQERCDVFLTQLSALTPMVVLHNAEGASIPIAPTPVTQLTVESKIATQRKRLRP